MFKQYLGSTAEDLAHQNNEHYQSSSSDQNQISLQSQQESVWDEYIDRQLEHLVVEYQFDFDKIGKRLAGVVKDKDESRMNSESCRERWKFLHLKRYQDKEQDRLNRVSISVMKFEDPINAMTLSEIVERLPKNRQQKDFLAISDEEKLQARFLNEKGEKEQPTTFNVLKDSVMGIKDKKEREKAFAKQQEEFFKSLETLAGEQDEEMFEKPLVAKFPERNLNFIVEREELTKEEAQKIMSQKIQMKGAGLVPPEPEMGVKMDNFVSMFARPPEEEEDIERQIQEKQKAMKIEEVIDQEEQKEETQRDFEDLQKQMDLTEDEKKEIEAAEEEKKRINADLFMAERGLKSIDDAVGQLEKMRKHAKVNNYFEEEQKRQEQEKLTTSNQQKIQEANKTIIKSIIEANINPKPEIQEAPQEEQQQEEQQQQQEEYVSLAKQNQNEENQEVEFDIPIDKAGEELMRQEIIKQGLASLNQKEKGEQLVQFHESQIKKDIKELDEIVKSKQQQSQPTKNKQNDKPNPMSALARFQRQMGNEENDSGDDSLEEVDEEYDELYIEAQRAGLQDDDQIEEYIEKKRKQKVNNENKKDKNKKVRMEDQNTQDVKDSEELLSEQERQIEQKKQFLSKLKEKKKNNELDEENEDTSNWRNLQFSAGLAFKKQLEEEEMQRQIKQSFEEEQRRKADAEKIRLIEEEYTFKKLDIEDKLKKKDYQDLEKLNSEKWKEYLETQSKRREEIEREHEDKLRQEQEEQERIDNENLIKDKIHYFENKIKSFKNNDPFKSYFDEQVSYLRHISSLPTQISSKIEDLKKYDISRDGITSRYQIVIFPYLENSKEFSSEFLGFFLRNSFFRQPPNDGELGDVISNSSSSQSAMPIPRLSSKGFPFCLVSFYVGSFAEEINDEQEDQYVSNYLQDSMKLDGLISEGKVIKSLFLFFDTYLGRGSTVLSKQLDLELSDFMSPAAINSATKKYGETVINSNMKLNDFKIKYMKSMEVAKKLFVEAHTFHSICPVKEHEPSLSSIASKNLESSLLIIRQYSEVAKPSTIIRRNNRNIDDSTSNHLEDTTLDVQTGISDSFSNIVPSETEISQKQKSIATDVIQYTINRLEEKGIQLLGMKSFYFDKQTHSEFKNYIENLHFNPNPNQPFVVLAVAAYDLHAKLKKIVGSEDAQLAKRLESNSLNALFSHTREDSILTPYNKALSRRMLSYFFAGRLQKIETVDDVKAIEGGSGKRQLYLTKLKPFTPVFLLNSAPLRDTICVLGPQFTPNSYGEVLKKIQERGFTLKNLKITDASNMAALAKQDEEFGVFAQAEYLQDLCKDNHPNLVLHIAGSNVRGLRTYLLKKILDFNPFFHPPKREILFFTKNRTQFQLLQDVLIPQPIKYKFTPSESFPFFFAIWPFIKENTEQHYLGTDMKVFSTFGLELLSVSKIIVSQISPASIKAIESIFQPLISSSLTVNALTRRKEEFSVFSTRLASELVAKDFIIATLRFQGDKNSKSFMKLYSEIPFVDSNKTVTENTIISYGSQNKNIRLTSQFLTQIFLEPSPSQVEQIATHLKIGVFDDWSFPNSFIYDLPSNGFTGELETLMILSDDVIQKLLLQGLAKTLEANQFKIKSFFRQTGSSNLSLVLHSNLFSTILAAEQAHTNQDQGTRLQLTKLSVDSFLNRLISEKMNYLVLSKQNGIFSGKKMLFEIAEKYSVFKKENIPTDSISEYMLERGMYSSLNFDCQQKELAEIKMMEKQIISLNVEEEEAVVQGDKKMSDTFENQILAVFRIDQLIRLSDIFRKLNVDLKFKVMNYLVIKQFEWEEIKHLTTHFTPRFDPIHIQTYFEVNNDGVYCIVQMDSKQAVSISDAFGTIRLNDKGEYRQIIQGSLFGKVDNFLIYTNNPVQIKKLYHFAFSNCK